MTIKKALITGINGQDGSYLAELLLSKGYEVHGIVRADSSLTRLQSIAEKIKLHEGVINDSLSFYRVFLKVMPDECYHLAASSFVSYDLSQEFDTFDINCRSTHNILATVKELKPQCKLFFAGSSEMFGEPNECPQSEESLFNPKSIYGISKVASYHLLKNYRDREGIFASTGIMYNHESPRRGDKFVTQKIVKTAVDIKLGKAKELRLGNLDACRDWGAAKDYVHAMWLILQHSKSDDFIISTGILRSVREFLETVFSYLDLDYRDYVVTDPKFFRASEHIPLCGNFTKIKSELGWIPGINFESMVIEMVEQQLTRGE